MDFKKENYREFEMKRMVYATGSTESYKEAEKLEPKENEEATPLDAKRASELQTEKTEAESRKPNATEDLLTKAAKEGIPSEEKKEESKQAKTIELKERVGLTAEKLEQFREKLLMHVIKEKNENGHNVKEDLIAIGDGERIDANYKKMVKDLTIEELGQSMLKLPTIKNGLNQFINEMSDERVKAMSEGNIALTEAEILLFNKFTNGSSAEEQQLASEKKDTKEKPKSFDQMSPGEIIGTFLALINSPVFKEAFKTGDYQTIMDVIDDFSHTRNPQETMDKAKTLFEEKLATMNVNDMISLYKEPRGTKSKELFGEKQPYLIQLRTVIESKLKTELGLSQNATMTMDSTVDNKVALRTTDDNGIYEIKIDGTNNKVSKSKVVTVEGVETKTDKKEMDYDGSLADLGVKLANPDSAQTKTGDAAPADGKAQAGAASSEKPADGASDTQADDKKNQDNDAQSKAPEKKERKKAPKKKAETLPSDIVQTKDGGSVRIVGPESEANKTDKPGEKAVLAQVDIKSDPKRTKKGKENPKS